MSRPKSRRRARAGSRAGVDELVRVGLAGGQDGPRRDPRTRRRTGRAARVARSSGDPRDRIPGRRSRGSRHVLAEPTETGWDGAGIWLARVVGPEAVRAESGAGQFPACVMRAQRDAVHPASRRASPARHNPPALDSCEPASHNASPGDITNSTPPGLAPGSSGGDAPGPGPRSRSPGGGDTHILIATVNESRRNSPSRRRCSEGRTRWAPKHFSPGAPTRKSRAIPVRKAHWVAEIPLGQIL